MSADGGNQGRPFHGSTPLSTVSTPKGLDDPFIRIFLFVVEHSQISNMMYSFNTADGYYNPNMSSAESPNSSNNSTRTSDSGSSFMDMQMVTPIVTPMATAMNSPCFPMPGQNYQVQQAPVQPYVPIGFEEAMIVQAQAARAQVNANAQAYFSWVLNNPMQHGSPQDATARQQPHDLYSHPYALSQRHIQQAFQLAEEERRGGRIPFTAQQLAVLKERFGRSDSIRIEERREMAKYIGLSEKQIKIWFQNRRFKLRKEVAAKSRVEPLVEQPIEKPIEKLMAHTKLEENNDSQV
ncbi:unnamed protein product [Caenorhabditis brenneri]